MTKQLVFVYGTLKRGQPNNARFLGPPSVGWHKFEGVGETFDRYPLVIASAFNSPFILAKKGQGEVSNS